MSDDRDWHGTAAELAALAGERLESLGFDDDKVNERLVRYYVSERVLSRPRREGREALFGYRQLLELLAARLLSRDGWPLAKIASWNQGADERALSDLIPERKPPRDAAGRTEERSESGTAGIAGALTERLMAAHQCPAFEAEPMVRIRVPGVLELLLPAAEVRSMTGDKAERYARLVRDVLRGMKPTDG
ncbi:hypothetical protein F2Q65_13015 [Thiohalocapsa marina]|uniref:MerR family transcriptional regulator n=1 Tax=Thiohalocapsa marina TaxID=424902 RepID=A0A5M8FJR8_9GAMM|nr:hypothetical protein [Thiohalocapsa marina]KAA6184230.1 hypothetical protein F2Q65_13015 [Thiohalocapsa marina]